MRLCLSAAVLILAGFPALSGAQVVRGLVRDESTGLPLRGAFVVLAEVEGTARAAVLADAQGNFLLRAPRAGRYQLSAQLIGYGISSPPSFSLGAEETRTGSMPSRPLRSIR